MSWKVRHEGSPRSIDGLTLPQVLEGLRDGLWEPTDEVLAPEATAWVALEAHPQLAEVVADLEPRPTKAHADDSNLDMNPLIDVCLVLLIFFILTASYQSLHKVLEMPAVPIDSTKPKVPQVAMKDVKERMILVKASREKDQTVIKVEDKPVAEKDLVQALTELVRSTRKTELLLDSGPEVDWGTTAAIQDAAKGAGIGKVNFLTRAPASGGR